MSVVQRIIFIDDFLILKLLMMMYIHRDDINMENFINWFR